jgi:hypothetical protein
MSLAPALVLPEGDRAAETNLPAILAQAELQPRSASRNLDVKVLEGLPWGIESYSEVRQALPRRRNER